MNVKNAKKKLEFDKGKFWRYIAGKLLATLAALVLVLLALFTALNTVNVQVITEDGFSKRASVILTPVENSDTELLGKVFTQDFLNETELDTQTRNRGYTISNYAQSTSVSFHIVFPWSKKVKLTVEDEISDISAALTSTLPEDQGTDYFIQSGVYDVVLVKQNGSWLIDSIEMKEDKTIKGEDIPQPSESAEVTESWDE